MSTKSEINQAYSPFSTGPFPHPDVFYGSGWQCLQFSDMANCAKVNSHWHAFMHSRELSGFWLAMFDKEKIPRIEDREAHAMTDFIFMYPITYSARKMACLGEFIGDVPKISIQEFFRLKENIDLKRKRIPPGLDYLIVDFLIRKLTDKARRFIILVEPLAIKRPFDENLVNDLVANGDFNLTSFDIEDIRKNGILVPYSLKNLKILAENPLINRNDYPVFNGFAPEILQQCNTIAKHVQVTIIERRAILIPGDHSYRREFLAKYGYEMIPLQPLLYKVVTGLLNLGKSGPKGEATTFDTFTTANKVWSVRLKIDKSIKVFGDPSHYTNVQMASRPAEVLNRETHEA